MITNRPYTSLFIEEGGLDPLQTNFRANPANLTNNHSTKLGTLICSVLAWTVRPTGADRPPVQFGSKQYDLGYFVLEASSSYFMPSSRVGRVYG
jgi:hypothetical protein